MATPVEERMQDNLKVCINYWHNMYFLTLFFKKVKQTGKG